MTGKTETDPWRLAWTITARKLRKLALPGWGFCMMRLEGAAMDAFRGALQSMIGAAQPGKWQQAHDAAIAAARDSVDEQRRERDPDTLKRWAAWGAK